MAVDPSCLVTSLSAGLGLIKSIKDSVDSKLSSSLIKTLSGVSNVSPASVPAENVIVVLVNEV